MQVVIGVEREWTEHLGESSPDAARGAGPAARGDGSATVRRSHVRWLARWVRGGSSSRSPAKASRIAVICRSGFWSVVLTRTGTARPRAERITYDLKNRLPPLRCRFPEWQALRAVPGPPRSPRLLSARADSVSVHGHLTVWHEGEERDLDACRVGPEGERARVLLRCRDAGPVRRLANSCRPARFAPRAVFQLGRTRRRSAWASWVVRMVHGCRPFPPVAVRRDLRAEHLASTRCH